MWNVLENWNLFKTGNQAATTETDGNSIVIEKKLVQNICQVWMYFYPPTPIAFIQGSLDFFEFM